ncbi:SusC/RagA family TonB-linked outer membrane protein [Bacteroidia bacterium]|nr:SusC/RagA family TonB-linked outer membrane protein [Bacteroidia bacterium]
MRKNKAFAGTLWFFLLFFCCQAIWAQQKNIQGTVKEPNGEAIIGASVVVKGASAVGTATDLDGKFKLSVPNTAKTLIVSYLGMKTQEVSITGSDLTIVLENNPTDLDEVVVIGYGTSTRKELTGSIASVDEKVLMSAPVASSAEAITGRMAGVNVLKTEGSPDAEIQIRVRGTGSITQDTSPLYIVDGFPVKSISDISPRDIQSIDVLKDAASTAIYGAEGANGVVIITTKKGKAGRVSATANSYVGYSRVYRLTEVLSPYEFVYLQRELDAGASLSTGFFGTYGLWEDIDIYRSKAGNNWQKEIFGNTGVHQNHNVSITGGSDKTSYLLSLTHDDESYIMNTSDFSRNNVNFRVNSSLNKYIDFDFNIRMSNTLIDGASVSGGKKMREAIKYAPTRGISDLTEDDLYEAGATVETIGNLKNPMTNINNEYRKQHQFRNTYNAGLTWKPVNWLSYRTQASYEFQQDYTDNVWIKGAGESSSNGGYPLARRIDDKGDVWSWNNTLTFNKTFDKVHKLILLAGQEMKSSQSKRMQVSSKFFPMEMSAEDVLANWDKGEPMPTYTTEYEPSRTFSYFGRVNYTLNGRYLFTLNARYDGKNVFSKENRWGFFPGGAVAWRLSDEPFMAPANDWLSNLKFRLSYGEGGNARVSSNWRLLYSTVSTQNRMYYPGEKPASSLQPGNTLNNEHLTWESKVSSNAGLDFGFWKERLSGTLDFYNDITKNLILSVPMPVHSGFTSQYQNVGKVGNKGVELTLNGYIIDTRDFRLSANFNIAFNRNKVLKYASADGNYSYISAGTTGSDVDFYVCEGQEVGLMWGFVSDGIYSFDDFTWDATGKKWDLAKDENGNNKAPDMNSYISIGNYFGPGALKLKDLDGDGVITDNDRTIIGHAQPKHTGGFGFSAQYKGFDASTFFNWSYGNQILNANKIDNTAYSGSKRNQNQSAEMSLANRWTTIDPETGQNIMYGTYADPDKFRELNVGKTIWHPIFSTTYLHSWAIEDGSFLRLSNLTVGYTIPRKWTQKALIQDLRLYLTAYNLYCWTKYTGQDPEVSTRSSSPLTPGIDNSAYPKSHSYVMGASITF